MAHQNSSLCMEKNPVLLGESDADWIGDQNDQNWTTGFISNLALSNSGAI